MKVMAFSDLHLAKARARDLVAASADADLVIGAGDFCNRRAGLDDAFGMLAEMAAPMIVVPGNAESLQELQGAVPEGTIVLHGSAATVSGLTFFGLGYAVPETPFGDWSCDLSEAAAADMLGACDRADVMIVHSPPKGVADVASNGQSFGSVSVRAAIERVAPPLVLCGHIHDCWGERGKIGSSEIVNLGPTPNWFEL